MIYFLRVSLVTFFLLVCSFCRAQDMEEALDAIIDEYNLVGMAVGVACGDETQETFFGGDAILANGTPVTAETHFRIASISKAFTAAGLLKLIDEGLADLDEDVGIALGYTLENPSFPGTPITYRMVLSHTSSLQDGSGYGDFLGATIGSTPIPNISEVLIPGGEFFTSNMWRTESPGSHFAYSNINYGLAGTLIEALSGERFDVYMRDEILLPMGLTASFNIDDIAQIGDMATLYRNSQPQADNFGGVAPPPFDGSGYVPGTNGARFGPQGSLRCSLGDLLKFGKMLYNQGMHDGQEILDSAIVSEMLLPQWTYSNGNGDNYFGLFRSWGLGIHRALGSNEGDAVFPGIEMLGHPGEAYGLISDLYFQPETGVILAFVTNGYLSGGNYENGQNSTFYRVEEEVFETIYNSYWDVCANVLPIFDQGPAQDLCEGVRYDAVRNVLKIPNGAPGTEVAVHNILGTAIWKGDWDENMPLTALKPGIYVASVSASTENCAIKFLLGQY